MHEVTESAFRLNQIIANEPRGHPTEKKLLIELLEKQKDMLFNIECRLSTLREDQSQIEAQYLREANVKLVLGQSSAWTGRTTIALIEHSICVRSIVYPITCLSQPH